VQHPAGAVGEVIADVAEVASELAEERLARFGVGGERSVGISVGARMDLGKRRREGRESVEIGAEPLLGLAQRVFRFREDVVAQEAEPVEEAPDLVFEVLDLVEVAAPVRGPLSHPSAAEQRRRVAKPLALIGEVPHAAVFELVEVARSAAHVALHRHALVFRVVEDLLAAEDGWLELFVRDGRHVGELDRPRIGRIEDRADVVHDDVPRERPLHEHAVLRAEHGGARREPGVHERGHERARVTVAHLDAVGPRERDEGVVAERAEFDVRREIAIVEVDAARELLGALRQVEDGRHRPHDVVLGERLHVADDPAKHVVLLRRHPRLPPVGAQADREEVVRQTAPLLVGVERRRVGGDLDALGDLHGGAVDDGELAVRVGRDETRDVDALAVVRDRHAARPEPHVELADDLSRIGAQFEELAGGRQGDVRRVARRAHDDADGLRRVRQAEAAFDDEPIQVDDGDGVIVAMQDPQLAARRDRERLGPLVDGELGDFGEALGVDRAHRVVVLVDRVNSAARFVVHDGRRLGRPAGRHGEMNRVDESDAREAGVVFDGELDGVMSGLGVRVVDRGAIDLELRTHAVSEAPPELRGAHRVGYRGAERERRAHERGFARRHVGRHRPGRRGPGRDGKRAREEKRKEAHPTTAW
jgi:hypothetical protein